MVTKLKKGATKKNIQNVWNKLADKSTEGLNAKKHNGVIKLTEDALFIQKKLRDEWD